MINLRSFQTRVFLAIFTVALIPTVTAIVVGSFVLGGFVSSAGTAGPWDAVAESGRALIGRVQEAVPDTAAVAGEIQAHRRALSESARLSRLYAYVTDRFLGILPLLALGTGILLAGIAFLAARLVSRSFSRPVEELIGWTDRIARGEPLPRHLAGQRRNAEEFDALAGALRRMADQIEESRRRAIENERLRTWTEMARRVAHELKNPLTPMRMAVRTLAADPGAGAKDAVPVLEAEIERLDDMARSFSQFGRLPEGPPSDVDLRELVEGLATTHTSEAVAIRVDGPADVPLVRGHYEALSRALRNILVNALDAMEGRRGEVQIALRPAGEGTVEVSVADRGPGFGPEVGDRIWDPGFTSKGRGTGLGLAMVRQTIEGHGGRVEARNRDGGGAEVVIVLPTTEATDRAAVP